MAEGEDDWRRAAEALATEYGATREDLTRRRDVMGGVSPGARYVFLAGWLHSPLIELARDHRAECDLGVCRTCEHIREVCR